MSKPCRGKAVEEEGKSEKVKEYQKREIQRKKDKKGVSLWDRDRHKDNTKRLKERKKKRKSRL